MANSTAFVLLAFTLLLTQSTAFSNNPYTLTYTSKLLVDLEHAHKQTQLLHRFFGNGSGSFGCASIAEPYKIYVEVVVADGRKSNFTKMISFKFMYPPAKDIKQIDDLPVLRKYEGSFRWITYEWTDILADGSRYTQMEDIYFGKCKLKYNISYISKKYIRLVSEQYQLTLTYTDTYPEYKVVHWPFLAMGFICSSLVLCLGSLLHRDILLANSSYFLYVLFSCLCYCWNQTQYRYKIDHLLFVFIVAVWIAFVLIFCGCIVVDISSDQQKKINIPNQYRFNWLIWTSTLLFWLYCNAPTLILYTAVNLYAIKNQSKFYSQNNPKQCYRKLVVFTMIFVGLIRLCQEFSSINYQYSFQDLGYSKYPQMSIAQLLVLEVNILLNYPDIYGLIVKNVVARYQSIKKWKKNVKRRLIIEKCEEQCLKWQGIKTENQNEKQKVKDL